MLGIRCTAWKIWDRRRVGRQGTESRSGANSHTSRRRGPDSAGSVGRLCVITREIRLGNMALGTVNAWLQIDGILYTYTL